MTIQEIIEKIKVEVHLPLDTQRYEETMVQNETNCYSHAIGATTPSIQVYRIGAISGRKDIGEKFKSTEEIINLLKEDLDVLGLKYETITDFEKESPNLAQDQYIICLYAKIYANGMLADYHFIRYEAGKWSEKWRGRKPTEIWDNYYEERWEWKRLMNLKITR